jgi:hypothetical protein
MEAQQHGKFKRRLELHTTTTSLGADFPALVMAKLYQPATLLRNRTQPARIPWPATSNALRSSDQEEIDPRFASEAQNPLSAKSKAHRHMPFNEHRLR